MSFVIKNINVWSYYSVCVKKETLEEELLGAKCLRPGTLRIILKPNRKLVQEGPYIIPPIRWVDSFGTQDEFDIECEIK